MANSGYVSSIPAWMAYKRQLLIHPTFDAIGQNYDRFRIPRPPEFDAEGTEPGKICWGTVGQMPQAQPMPSVDFNTHREISRKSQDVRIENPDDPSQYVIADRPTEITFDGKQNKAPPGPNTYSQPAPGMSDYTVEFIHGFKSDVGEGGSSGTTTYIYSPTSRTDLEHGPR